MYSAVVLAYVKIVIGRFQTYGPEMLATFNDLGKGVAAASWDYTVIASAATYDAAQVALAYMKIVMARFEKYGPDALDTFSDIGKGVAAASAVYWAVAMEYAKIVAARFEKYGPDAIGTFKDIGKGVAAASAVYAAVAVQYSKIGAAVALEYMKIVMARFEEYGPGRH